MIEIEPKKLEEQEAGNTHIFHKSIFALIIRIILLWLLWLTLYLIFSFVIYLLRNNIATQTFFYFNLIFLIVLQLFFAGLSLYITVVWLGEVYIVEPPKITLRKGVIVVIEEEIDVGTVQSYSVQQNVIGRLFKYGTVKLISTEEIVLHDIPNPHHVAEIFLTKKENN